MMFPTFSRIFFETLRSARTLFLSGLLVVVPLGITILIFYSLFDFFDSWFHYLKRMWLNNPPDWIVDYLPPGTKEGIDLFIGSLPPFGVGFLLTIVLIFLIGFTTRLYLGKKIVVLVEWIFNQIPGVSIVYNGLKQVVEQLIGRGNTLFDKVVLIEYPRKGIYSIAFVTGDAVYFEKYTQKELCYVFIATSPNPTSGVFIMIPKDDMIDLELTVEEAMKMVISSGMVAPQALVESISKPTEGE